MSKKTRRILSKCQLNWVVNWWCHPHFLLSIGGADCQTGGAAPPQNGLVRTLIAVSHL